MERVVKFRGKVVNHDPMTNPENGWVEGYYYQDLDNGVVKHYIFNCPCCWEVIPESVGQFTGLHDKNGKGIYEGDIVKQTWGSPHYVKGVLYDCFGRIGDIRYECDLIGVHTKNGMYRIVGIDISNTVIGNIHDNPNLLTDGRN